jgi:hypothetical protein
MADSNTTEEALVKTAMREGAPLKQEDNYEKMYQVISDDKIPISKIAGKLWQSRRDQSKKVQENSGARDAWDEAIRYYRNDQSKGRSDSTAGGRLSRRVSDTSGNHTETENIVFSNVSALVPALYAKNPDCEISWNKPENEDIAPVIEKLIDVLAIRKTSPGINLKPKIRRGVVTATLTNECYFEVGWTPREASRENALTELAQISDKLAKAKEQKDIMELEGQLMAIEQKVDLLRPAGPWVKFRAPQDVLFDTDSVEPDHSDANWWMVTELMSTELIRAMYGKKDEDGNYKSIYQPTHVLKAGHGVEEGHEDAHPSLFQYSNDKSGEAYGYTNEDSYKRGCRTRVWWVWDKTCRRLYLYNDADWSWPIWVWNDPYRLPNFVPIVPLIFYTDPFNQYARAEVSYYLDQQDAINDINSEIKKIRDYASGKYVYNKNVLKDKTAVQSFVDGGNDERILGIDADPNIDLSKVITALLPPSAGVLQVFDKAPQLTAIDRISSVTNVMRGAEFKTNTTNKAIETYESQTQTRLDEKMDCIEECIGDILQLVAFMCLQFMDAETVGNLIGQEAASKWINMSPEEIVTNLSLRVTGGSTLKPTSRAKKEGATQLAQILGQFASATPLAVYFAMKILARAFSDDMNISDDEWKLLLKSLEQAIGAQGAGAGGPQAGATEGGAPADAGGPPAQGGGGDDPLAMLSEFIDQLPPEGKALLGEAIKRGIPVQEAVARTVEAAKQESAQRGNGRPTTQ